MRRALIATLVCAVPIGAQQPAASPYATVVGVVVDSIHGGPLVGAVVIVSGADRYATVDSTGRFRIDSIPPGDHVLGVFHPLLDSLNISVSSRSTTLPAGETTAVIMATPSATSEIAIFCPDSERRGFPGAVIGRVLTAEQDDPIKDAVVRFTSVETGRFRTKFIQDAKVTSTGSFVLCGVPVTASGTVHASRGQTVSGEVTANTSKWLAIVTVRLDTLKRGTAVVIGRIVDDKGKAVPHADIELANSHIKTVTSDSGTFALRYLPAGSQTIQVRKVGYTAIDTSLMLSSKTPVQFDMTLRVAPVVLSTVTIERERALARVGFDHRRKQGLGYFLAEDQIKNRGGVRFSDLARSIPGLIVRETRFGDQVILQGHGAMRRGCVGYLVDGMPFTDRPLGSIDTFVHPEDVIALEVYQPAEAPATLVIPPANCAVVVIWTRATAND